MNNDTFTADAINDVGQVIGRDFVNAFPGTTDDDFFNNVILVQPGGTSSRIIATNGQDEYCFPHAMNILGQAVGQNFNLFVNTVLDDQFYDEGDAMLYNPDGNSVSLGNFLTEIDAGFPPGSDATGINSFGVIVGSCYTADSGVSRGFVYLNGTMYDLNDLVNATAKGLTITTANGINDLGQIVGTANDAAGNEHAVILTVVGSKAAIRP
jgi:probable HAF family extracellular repeat protein